MEEVGKNRGREREKEGVGVERGGRASYQLKP
jgi:hypothetical protein